MMMICLPPQGTSPANTAADTAHSAHSTQHTASSTAHTALRVPFQTMRCVRLTEHPPYIIRCFNQHYISNGAVAKW